MTKKTLKYKVYSKHFCEICHSFNASIITQREKGPEKTRLEKELKKFKKTKSYLSKRTYYDNRKKRKNPLEIDIPHFLEEFRKKPDDERLREEYAQHDLSEYYVELNSGTAGYYGSDVTIGNIYRDAPYHFILRNNGLIIATLGFEPYSRAILISQLQGSPNQSASLAPIKWSKALLRTATNWAFENRIPRVYVLPHTRNKWYAVQSNRHGNPRLIYDITAKREGFNYDPIKGVYVKSNPSQSSQ